MVWSIYRDYRRGGGTLEMRKTSEEEESLERAAQSVRSLVTNWRQNHSQAHKTEAGSVRLGRGMERWSLQEWSSRLKWDIWDYPSAQSSEIQGPESHNITHLMGLQVRGGNVTW